MISVIVPVYKVEPYLRQCLDSIINQTYLDLEILLIEDCSPDHCGEICEEYKAKDDRVRVFHNEENRGLSASRNAGLREAKGEYIGFVDSDDWIEPEMYEFLLKEIEQNEADLVVCGIYREERQTSKPVIYMPATYESPRDSLSALIHGEIGSTVWNKLYKAGLFKTIRFPEGHNYEDVATMHMILAKSSKTVVVAATAYHYRVRKNSISKTKSASNQIDFANACILRYNYFKEEQPALFQGCKTALLRDCAKGITKVWIWWYGCKDTGRYEYRIEELKQFTRKNLSPFQSDLPLWQRILLPFMRHNSGMVFAMLYGMNKIYQSTIKGTLCKRIW